MTSEASRRYRAGEWLDDLCRQCKSVRRHTVLVADAQGTPLRVLCDTCASQHNYRGPERAERISPARVDRPVLPRETSLVSERERSEFVMSMQELDLELMLRRVIREEFGMVPVALAERWRGGDLVFKPGKPGVQEKAIPIETFFHKIVMLRNRLRTLEQQVNASGLPEDQKLKLHGYITGCYGSLTSFNILFADDDEKFVGSGSSD